MVPKACLQNNCKCSIYAFVINLTIDLFEGYRLASPGGPYVLSYSGGLAQVGDKAQRY